MAETPTQTPKNHEKSRNLVLRHFKNHATSLPKNPGTPTPILAKIAKEPTPGTPDSGFVYSSTVGTLWTLEKWRGGLTETEVPGAVAEESVQERGAL